MSKQQTRRTRNLKHTTKLSKRIYRIKTKTENTQCKPKDTAEKCLQMNCPLSNQTHKTNTNQKHNLQISNTQTQLMTIELLIYCVIFFVILTVADIYKFPTIE